MSPPDGQLDVTLLINAAAAGDAAAVQLLPLVDEQLRGAAQQRLASERDGHTLSATALVHEASLKLVGPRRVPWSGRGHFDAAAAQAMRRILIDHARSRGRKGGSADGRQFGLDFRDVAELAVHGESEEIIALDEALLRLESQRCVGRGAPGHAVLDHQSQPSL